MYTAKNMIV